jgi:hypothetical protein
MSAPQKFLYQIVIEGALLAPSKEIAEATVATQLTASLNLSASFTNVSVFVEPESKIAIPSAHESANLMKRGET